MHGFGGAGEEFAIDLPGDIPYMVRIQGGDSRLAIFGHSTSFENIPRHCASDRLDRSVSKNDTWDGGFRDISEFRLEITCDGMP